MLSGYLSQGMEASLLESAYPSLDSSQRKKKGRNFPMLRGLSIPSSIIMAVRSSSKRVQKSSSSSHPYQQYPYPPPISISFSSSSCKHPPSATLDLLILILVLFSLSFLLFSSLSHLLRSISPFLLHSLSLIRIPYYLLTPLLLLSFPLSLTLCLLCRHFPRRRCRNPKCRGLKKALEFDVQLQTDEVVADPVVAAMWKEIDALPWKGGQGGNNPDYECLRAELRKMAPVNGRAVLLFRSRCGCPLAKLEAWGPKRGRQRWPSAQKGHTIPGIGGRSTINSVGSMFCLLLSFVL